MVPPGLERDYALIRNLPLFEGIPNQDLIAAMTQGGIAHRQLERDMFVLDPIGLQQGQPAPVIYIARGQVAAAVFMENELSERRAQQLAHENASKEEREQESLIKPPPLARIALKNVALFMEGDLFNSGALSAARSQPIAFYTASPSILISLDHRWIAELAVRHPPFEARLRRALSVSRERLAWVSGVKQELLDFFVRQGISVSGEMVRVRQLELCIDCKLCEEACEERYGARRLTLGGYQLGMLDFIYTCRTCTDQRCIDPCAYDSIKFDEERKEVVINEATCTGCTACAQACPYGAIDMVEIEPDAPTFKKEFKHRLDKHGALRFGPGTGRIARTRKIANKCDHCIAYGDQACVSACPTGSLIEIDAYDLFRERSPAMALLARTGFDVDLQKKDRKEVLPVLPFTEGLDVRSGGMAKVKRGRYAPLVMWVVGLLVFLLMFGEILLRLYAKDMSYLYSRLKNLPEFAGLTQEGILEKVDYRAGPGLSVYCGLIGAGLMVVAAIYPIFRRIKMFRWFASNTMWFDFHMMAGTVGPLFIMLHSWWKFDTWVSAAFWSMAIVVISGVLGRYLYTLVPSLSSGVELEELDHERAFQAARAHYPVPMAEIDRELTEQRAKAQRVAQSTSLLRAMWWLIFQDVGRIPRTLARRNRLAQLGVDRRTRKDLARRAGRMIVIARRQVVAPKAQLLLHSWKKVHVPFTVLLTGFAVVHIWDAWSRAW
jgi:Fe-S-cluster-containing hydrogenase component 2